MKIVGLSGSNVGRKTRTAMDHTLSIVEKNYPESETVLIDLAEVDMVFSDGRNYHDYEGDTKQMLETIMEADAIIIGSPVFQSSIPASLKNVFDLLPVNAFRDKVISFFITAGTSKHYLIAEHQMKPILAYMKAHIVETHVFIEEVDFLRKEIINDDVLFRLNRMVEDTFMMIDAYKKIREQKDLEYGF